jgi:hypothetical protein
MAIHFAHRTGELASAHDFPQGVAGLSARAHLAAGRFAPWRIDAPEHNAMLADRDAVAVSHRSAASDHGRGRVRGLRLCLHRRNRNASRKHQSNCRPDEIFLAAQQ